MADTIEIEQQVLKELEMLASVVKFANNSIVILDKEGSIEWVNNAFKTMHGYSSVENGSFYATESIEFVKILNETDRSFFQKNNSIVFTRDVMLPTHKRRYFQSSLTAIKNAKNQVDRFIVIETDITQQKELEEELVQRYENTQTLTEHLESVKDYVEEQIQELSEQKKALEIAKEKSEEVLNKVLPYEVAIQLKKKGYASPRHYKKVSVIQLNIRNFFKLTDTIAIEELVEQLHQSMVSFDNVLENHYVEKIKTTGGIYLGAGGVPLRNRSNPIDVVLSSLEIMELIKQINNGRREKNMPEFITGIGIHTGKVIAGVVGKNKLTYDIWGDTVNVASTVEQHTPEGKIYLSESTYHEITEYFDLVAREKLILESAEEINLFEVIKIKDKFALNAKGIEPNEEFMHILSKL